MEFEPMALEEEKGLENMKVACRSLRSAILPNDIKDINARGPGFHIRDPNESLLCVSFILLLLSFLFLILHYSIKFFRES